MLPFIFVRLNKIFTKSHWIKTKAGYINTLRLALFPGLLQQGKQTNKQKKTNKHKNILNVLRNEFGKYWNTVMNDYYNREQPLCFSNNNNLQSAGTFQLWKISVRSVCYEDKSWNFSCISSAWFQQKDQLKFTWFYTILWFYEETQNKIPTFLQSVQWDSEEGPFLLKLDKLIFNKNSAFAS